MSQSFANEAVCLLQTGALYHARLGLLPPHGELIFTGFKHGAFSAYFGDAPIFHFDLEGRWQRAYIEPTHYLKGLDTTVHSINRGREEANLVLRRRTLTDGEAQDLDVRIREMALAMIAELHAGRMRHQAPPDGKARPLNEAELRNFLQKIASWDAAAWSAHRASYHAAYGPLPFLPPECQNAVVLQATRGHAGGVAFAGGPAYPHEILDRDQFAEHAAVVASLLGRRLLQCKVAFLAGADVLRRPAAEVLSLLETIGRSIPIASQDAESSGNAGETSSVEGIHTFIDDFSAPRPTRAEFEDFRRRHLVRVGLGVESGDPQVRAGYRKRWHDDELRSIVADLKEVGLAVSILTLVGAGGEAASEDHVEGTSSLIASLPLERGDTVFLLDEKEFHDAGQGGRPHAELEGAAWSEQRDALKSSLISLKQRGVKVISYTVDKQWA